MDANEIDVKSEERLLADFFENAAIGLHWVGADGTIIRANRAELEMLGYSKEEYVGRNIAEFHVDRPVIEDILHKLSSGDTLRNYRARLRCKDGSTRHVLISSNVLWEDGKFIHTRCFTRDITDLTQTQEEAVSAQARLAAIVQGSDDGIVGKTLDGIVTSWNKGAERIFGYGPEEMIGQSIKKIIPLELHGEEDFILGKLRQGERVEHYETVRVTKDGRRIDVSLSSSPIRDAQGKVAGASKIVRDISYRKAAEEALRRNQEALRALTEKTAQQREQLLDTERAARAEAERLSSIKDDFLATLSHELRTPLSAILGWAQVLRRQTAGDADVQQGLETIERNARMQTQLIEDLLDMSRITSGQLRLDIQPLQPSAVIEAAIQTVRPSADAKGIRIEKVLDPSAGPISGDPSRLQQVVWNLLSNAVKFTPKDGKVQIVLQRVNSHIEISVADTGVGIEPEFLAHVFERFRQADSSTTRKYGGLGLGLSIVKHLVELHGGTVRAESPGKDRGATFALHLPVTVVHARNRGESRIHPKTPKAVSADFAVADLSGIRVLVVDDEADARDLMKRVLDECNAEVWTAGTALEALGMVEQQKPHVLVSDIGMPDVDGYEFLRRVRALGEAKGGKVPAIALTAFARSEDRTRALRAGFVIHVSKPVEPSELVATVASAAGRMSE